MIRGGTERVNKLGMIVGGLDSRRDMLSVNLVMSNLGRNRMITLDGLREADIVLQHVQHVVLLNIAGTAETVDEETVLFRLETLNEVAL